MDLKDILKFGTDSFLGNMEDYGILFDGDHYDAEQVRGFLALAYQAGFNLGINVTLDAFGVPDK